MSSIEPHQFYCLPWRVLPGAIPEDSEIFVIGDVHGQADLLAQALQSICDTPKQAATRKLVFLGDLIDRGPSSFKSIDLAMRGAEMANADELNILPGNHDLMLLDALDDEAHAELWLVNGGKTVLAELGLNIDANSWTEIREKLFQALNKEYLNLMKSGPSHLRLGDLLLVQAGIHPHVDMSEFLSLDRQAVGAEDHWSTIRYPFLDWEGGWDANDPDPDRQARRPTVVVHGHTLSLRSDLRTAEDLQICDCIDTYRSIALDIGAAYRPQLAWAHFRTGDVGAEVQVHAVVRELAFELMR